MEDLLSSFRFFGYFLFAIGILMTFFGKKLFKAFLFVAGGFMIGGGVFALFSFYGADTPSAVILGIAGFFAGGYLTVLFFYWVIFSVGFLGGLVISTIVFPQGGFPQILTILVLGSILGTLAVVIFEMFLAVSTALTGSHLTRLGMVLLGAKTTEAEAIGWTLFAMGTLFQVFLLDPIFGSIFKELDKKLGERLAFGTAKKEKVVLWQRWHDRVITQRFYFKKPKDLEKLFRKTLNAYERRKISLNMLERNVNTILKWLEKHIDLLQTEKGQHVAELLKLDNIEKQKKFKYIDKLDRKIEDTKAVLERIQENLGYKECIACSGTGIYSGRTCRACLGRGRVLLGSATECHQDNARENKGSMNQ